MTVKFSAFEISDYLDDEKVIAEYLSAAADDPNPEVLSRAKSDVVKARAVNSMAVKAMEPLPRVESHNHTAAIIIAILILTIVVQILLVKSWT
jgi:hypothetical protein